MKKIDYPQVKYIRLLMVLLGLVLVVLTVKIVLPKAGKTLENYKKRSSFNSRLVSLQAKIADLEGLNEYELSERNSLALQALPADKNIIGTMMILNSLTEQNGVLIEGLRVSPGSLTASGSAISGMGALSLDIRLNGSFDQMKAFLRTLKTTLPLILNTGNLTISFLGGSTSLKLEVYYLGLPKTLGKIDTPVPKLTDTEEKLLESLRAYTYLSPAVFTPTERGKANPFAQ